MPGCGSNTAQTSGCLDISCANVVFPLPVGPDTAIRQIFGCAFMSRLVPRLGRGSGGVPLVLLTAFLVGPERAKDADGAGELVERFQLWIPRNQF
jgi:hypothetical protein